MMEAKAKALVDQFHAEIEALVTGDDWVRMLQVASKFHQYSLSNCLLIQLQRPEATRVAGFNAWRSLGRYVRKGEKGIAILAPLVGKRAVVEEGAEKNVPFIRGFKVVYVFDVSQTEGEPLPEEPRPVLLAGEAPEGFSEYIADLIQREGFELLSPDPWDSDANGWTDFVTKQVAIRPDLSNAQRAKTLTHEYGHIRFHDGTEYSRGHRGRAEVEAESFAFVVCTAAGLATETYSLPYVAGWSGGDMKLVLATATRVIEAASTVIRAYLAPPLFAA